MIRCGFPRLAMETTMMWTRLAMHHHVAAAAAAVPAAAVVSPLWGGSPSPSAKCMLQAADADRCRKLMPGVCLSVHLSAACAHARLLQWKSAALLREPCAGEC